MGKAGLVWGWGSEWELLWDRGPSLSLVAAESGKGAVVEGEEVVPVEDEVVSEVSTEVEVDEEVEVMMRTFLVEDGGAPLENELD